MSKGTRDKVFSKAKSKDHPFICVDDEFLGTFATVAKLDGAGKLDAVFDY